MEEENVSSNTISAGGDQDEAALPGFRFHPTEEELVGFYLRRKVEKKPLKIELIKQADIYKYDPWDLPKSGNVGDKEWYFFCQRGRKYKNSMRPNRVTGSGFWKATGIDRPIYSSGGEGRDCIGLKKSLVYYLGSAGKGTKTDWMMHEFRLPAAHDRSAKHFDANTVSQEAEVWTLCRIFKRNFSYRKRIPDWKEVGSMKSTMDTNSKTCSTESSDHNRPRSGYISFNTSPRTMPQTDDRPYTGQTIPNHTQLLFPGHYFSTSSSVMSDQHPSAAASFSSAACGDVNELLGRADWEDLRSVVDCATADANYSAFFHE